MKNRYNEETALLYLKTVDLANLRGIDFNEAAEKIASEVDFFNGFPVEGDRLALHIKAVNLSAKKGISYEDALYRSDVNSEEEIADQEALRLHKKIQEYAEKHEICYDEALIAVTNKEGF